jgi:hypothetical protein
MGLPLMVQDADMQKIETLKERLGMRTKIEVVRAGLDLLDREAERTTRVNRWRRAAKLAARSSAEANAAFRPGSRLKRL